MQKVAAYLMERRDGMDLPDARNVEAERVWSETLNWLRAKGATDIGKNGAYRPEDGSIGGYYVERATDGERTWQVLRLAEETKEGRLFAAAISVTTTRDRVVVYATLEGGWTTAHILPATLDPRCPKILRTLLGQPGRWYHGPSILRSVQRTVRGFDDGEALGSEIEDAERSIPLVIVSTNSDGGVALPALDAKLAYDLAGLANVIVVDEDAAWALTDVLGSDFCCYWGAVRLFWPKFSKVQDRFVHPLWTAERLRAVDDDLVETRERFRKHLRGMVFRAAALSVGQPREIDDVRDAAGRRAVAELRRQATSLESFQELADSYAKENDILRADRSALQRRVDELEAEVAKLETDRHALLTHLRAAKAVPSGIDGSAPADDLAPAGDEAEAAGAPRAGEVRFYKKVHSRPTHDMMVRVQDCGCNKWESGHAGDKARKGIAKLENDRNDWKTLQHCASCTGGGMWRVRW